MEICICVLNYIKILVQKVIKPDLDIIFYSDMMDNKRTSIYLLHTHMHYTNTMSVVLRTNFSFVDTLKTRVTMCTAS